MRFVFIMDPIESIDVQADSTFVMMLEAQARGHSVYCATPEHLEQRGPVPWVRATPVELRRKLDDHFTSGPTDDLNLNEVDAVFLRKDPPFDVEYLINTYILDRVDRRRVVMINDPQAVRDANEKLYALHFSELMPATLVARDPAQIRAFIDEVEDVVVKPLTHAGGSGVIRISRGDKNTGAILELLTSGGRVAIEVQKYMPEVSDGDRRVLLIDGEPVGVVNRKPQDHDLRSNMHVGGVAEKATLTPRDIEICEALKADLKRRGLIFVGIDVIGGKLTEINVTSPTGMQEVNRFDEVSVEARLIDWVEARRVALAQAG